ANPELEAVGIGAGFPCADDEAKSAPEDEAADAPIGAGGEGEDYTEALRPAIDDLHAHANLKLDGEPDVEIDDQREPGALVGELTDCKAPRLVAEVETASKAGDVGKPAWQVAGGEITEREVDSDHDAEFFLIDVIFDGDE